MKSVRLPTGLPVGFAMAAALPIFLSACAPAVIGARLAPIDNVSAIAPPAATKGNPMLQIEARFVYGYTDGSKASAGTLCSGVAGSTPSNNLNYSVVICQEETALAYAALKEPEKELRSLPRDAATMRRLEQTATAELTSPEPIYSQQ